MNAFALPKIISVSDFQRKTRETFKEMSEFDGPTLVTNRNNKVGVFLSYADYNEIVEMLEDYMDALDLAEEAKNSKPEDFIPWEEAEKQLIKAGKLKPKNEIQD